jgi:hypothetical protein
MAELIELSIETAALPIDADDPAPDDSVVAELVPDVSDAGELRLDRDHNGNVEGDDVEADDAAAPENAFGVAADVSGVDASEVSDATVCAPVPAGVPAAWPTAAACPANPARFVVCAGGVKGINVDAACAAP